MHKIIISNLLCLTIYIYSMEQQYEQNNINYKTRFKINNLSSTYELRIKALQYKSKLKLLREQEAIKKQLEIEKRSKQLSNQEQKLNLEINRNGQYNLNSLSQYSAEEYSKLRLK